MSRIMRMLAALSMLTTLAGVALAATENPPDDYLCCAASAKNRKGPTIGGTRTELQDRFGGPQSFILRGVVALCNPATRIGAALSHPNVHLIGIAMRKDRTAPK